MAELWDQIAGAAGFTISPEQHAQLHRYLDLLMAANERMNLVEFLLRSCLVLDSETHHDRGHFQLVGVLVQNLENAIRGDFLFVLSPGESFVIGETTFDVIEDPLQSGRRTATRVITLW